MMENNSAVLTCMLIVLATILSPLIIQPSCALTSSIQTQASGHRRAGFGIMSTARVGGILTLHNSHPLKSDEENGSEEDTSRRKFMKDLLVTSATSLVTTVQYPSLAYASDLEAGSTITTSASPDVTTTDIPPPPQKVFVQGKVSLPSNIELSSQEENGPKAAVYITARPNSPDNVPKAILDGTRGKPPPVLAARVPINTNEVYPLKFTLTELDLTLEGISNKITTETIDTFWWEGLDLIVSARWDTDGVAATRDPTDLVGRALYSATNNKSSNVDSGVDIQLQGRGFTGKLVTGKSGKK